MAITRERKEELVAVYNELLQHTTGLVITEYRGLTMAQITDLRRRLREVNGAYLVTKNTLFSIALKESGWMVPEDLLLGPVATGFSDGNMPGMAKAMLAFQKEHPDFFIIKGAVMGEALLSPKDVQAIAELPTLDELRSQLAGLVVQPASGLLGVLNAATSDIVNVLHAYVQDKGGDSEEAA